MAERGSRRAQERTRKPDVEDCRPDGAGQMVKDRNEKAEEDQMAEGDQMVEEAD